MKTLKIVLSLLLLASAAAAQQEPFVIEGKIGSLNAPAKAYLFYSSNDEPRRDSVELADGRFHFSGNAAHAARATLALSHDGTGTRSVRDYLTVYLHQGTITVNSSDSVSKATISGSKLNEDNQRLQAALKPVNEKSKVLSAFYQAATEEERKTEVFRKSYQEKRGPIREETKAIQLDFIKNNPQSFISLSALQQYAGAVPDVETIEPLFTVLAPEVRNSEAGKAYATQLENIKRTAIGKPAPAFTQNDPDGNPVNLASYKGKYVLIDFWASWCGPCRAENPHVVKAYEQYKDKNFTVLGVSLDDEKGREAWLKAVQDDKLTWTQVSDLKGWKNEAAALYAVRAIPQNFLLDPNGVIVAKNLRGEALEKKLEELLH